MQDNGGLFGEADSVASEQGRRQGAADLVRAEWTLLGPLGRSAFLALLLASGVAVVMAIAIPNRVEEFLLLSEGESLARVIDDMETREAVAAGLTDAESLDRLDTAVQRQLLGREVVRVKVWSHDGTIIYSDARELIGQRFTLSSDLTSAFAGDRHIGVPDADHPENESDWDLGSIREFYIPMLSPSGSVAAVFEVYERADPLLSTVASVRTYVWAVIWGGIGLSAVFTVILFARNGRAVIRRQREAERMLGELVRAQDEERRRVVGALHDDIGQPLYRIHFGIEDCRARVQPGSAIDDELARIGTLVHQVDGTLRSELRALRDEAGAELDLAGALNELAESTSTETGLTMTVRFDDRVDLPHVNRSSLFQAAREAITNTRKHARASEVSISVSRNGDSVMLEIEDDGIGCDRAPGLGLVTARERLELIGGGLQVTTRRSGGTRFRAWVPQQTGELRQ